MDRCGIRDLDACIVEVGLCELKHGSNLAQAAPLAAHHQHAIQRGLTRTRTRIAGSRARQPADSRPPTQSNGLERCWLGIKGAARAGPISSCAAPISRYSTYSVSVGPWPVM
jgi:hypothetical protein